jgi:hypothetical protein
MQRSKALPWVRRLPCAALLVALWAAWGPPAALAQSQGPGTVTLRDCSEVHGASPPAAPLDIEDPFRADERVRLYDQLEAQRLTNRRWQVPAVGQAVGIASILSGALVLILSGTRIAGCSYADEDGSGSDRCPQGTNVTMERAALVLMPVGGALMLINTPLLIVRALRAGRMVQTEAAIRRLGGQVSFAPLLTPRGDAGLGARLSF